MRRRYRHFLEDMLVSARSIVDFRNVLIHEYFGVSRDITWDVIKSKLPVLIERLKLAIEKEP